MAGLANVFFEGLWETDETKGDIFESLNRRHLRPGVKIIGSIGILSLGRMLLGNIFHPKILEGFWQNETRSIEMFHTLHCVVSQIRYPWMFNLDCNIDWSQNHLRRAYYPEIYYQSPTLPKYVEAHRDHCLEHVRQYIMCHADMAPIPTKYFKSIDRNYVLSDMPHVCRNFDKLQDWILDRHHGPNAVQRYNATQKGW